MIIVHADHDRRVRIHVQCVVHVHTYPARGKKPCIYYTNMHPINMLNMNSQHQCFSLPASSATTRLKPVAVDRNVEVCQPLCPPSEASSMWTVHLVHFHILSFHSCSLSLHSFSLCHFTRSFHFMLHFTMLRFTILSFIFTMSPAIPLGDPVPARAAANIRLLVYVCMYVHVYIYIYMIIIMTILLLMINNSDDNNSNNSPGGRPATERERCDFERQYY